MSYPTDITYDRPFTQGNDWRPLFTVQDSNGAIVDLTAANTVAWIVIKRQGGSTTVSRATDDSDEYEWETDGTDGQVRFLFKAVDTLNIAVGQYNVEVFWKDSGVTPKEQRTKGRGIWTVEAPSTGTLTAP